MGWLSGQFFQEKNPNDPTRRKNPMNTPMCGLKQFELKGTGQNSSDLNRTGRSGSDRNDTGRNSSSQNG
ncbi:hypothetical protein HanIR_Chr12g0569811 [Helianthus annuus]|nr:hypothetical protein HanIR_Chr12g0569811 [Helianthus annuus]